MKEELTINKRIKFIIEYIKSPRTIGAITPSSRKLAEKMIQGINFDSASCIVEYGPGTGVFTELLENNIKKDSFLILIENNAEFCVDIKQKYGHLDNVVIINDSAINIDKHLKKNNLKNVDYIVSGLPFASLPEQVSGQILNTTRQILTSEGFFITFQYTLLKKKYFSNFFNNIRYEKVFFNIPPAYVLKCCND